MIIKKTRRKRQTKLMKTKASVIKFKKKRKNIQKQENGIKQI